MSERCDDKPECLSDAACLRIMAASVADVGMPDTADQLRAIAERMERAAPSAVAASFVPWDLETVKQEIRDLFARYGSGDYTPSEEEKEIIENALDEILTPPPAEGAPHGWKLVPERPTPAMLVAGANASPPCGAAELLERWGEMIGAAPIAPQSATLRITDEVVERALAAANGAMVDTRRHWTDGDKAAVRAMLEAAQPQDRLARAERLLREFITTCEVHNVRADKFFDLASDVEAARAYFKDAAADSRSAK